MGEKIIEGEGAGNFADGEDALKKFDADKRDEELTVGEINIDVFRTAFKLRTKFFEPVFREHDGDDMKMTGEQALNHLVAFGYKNALRGMLRRAAHRAIRFKLRGFK